jgi:transposase
MPAPRKYPDELRARAIRLVRDLVDDESEGLSVTVASRRVGDRLGINTDTLRNWVKQALVDDGEEPGGDHVGEDPHRAAGAGGA